MQTPRILLLCVSAVLCVQRPRPAVEVAWPHGHAHDILHSPFLLLDFVGQLQQLSALRDAGALTESEFEVAKAGLLASS